MSFLAEIWMFIRKRKKFWMVPMLLIMFIFGGLLVFVEGSAIAPFIYTIF